VAVAVEYPGDFEWDPVGLASDPPDSGSVGIQILIPSSGSGSNASSASSLRGPKLPIWRHSVPGWLRRRIDGIVRTGRFYGF
jgi:hypothetical protein